MQPFTTVSEHAGSHFWCHKLYWHRLSVATAKNAFYEVPHYGSHLFGAQYHRPCQPVPQRRPLLDCLQQHDVVLHCISLLVAGAPSWMFPFSEAATFRWPAERSTGSCPPPPPPPQNTHTQRKTDMAWRGNNSDSSFILAAAMAWCGKPHLRHPLQQAARRQ